MEESTKTQLSTPIMLTKGCLHEIALDIGGNLGLAWMVEFRNWNRFARWLLSWSRDADG